MKAGLLFALTHAVTIYDQCREFGIGNATCGMLGMYSPANYSGLLSGLNYPVLRDRSCENGHCLAQFYKNECEICDDDVCRRTCKEKKSNTKDLLEFLKEVLINRTKGTASNQFEIFNPDPPAKSEAKTITVTEQPTPSVATTTVTTTQPCNAANCPTQASASAQPQQTTAPQSAQPAASTPEITVYKTETKTISMYETEKPEPQRSTVPSSATMGIYGENIPCSSPLSNGNDCLRLIQMLQRSISPRANIKKQGKAPETGCTSEESACNSGEEPRKTKKRKSTNSSDCEASGCLTKDQRSTSSAFTNSSLSDSVAFSTSAYSSKSSTPSGPEVYVTVTRTIEKTTTVESPITLYREYTTTVEKEKPIINYKITTVTENSVSVSTRTVTQTEHAEPTNGNGSPSSSVGRNSDSGDVPQTVSVGPKDGSSNKNESDGLDNLLKKCSQLAECRDKLGKIPPELISTSKIPSKDSNEPITVSPSAQIVTKTEHVPFTVTVASKEFKSSSIPPVLEKSQSATSSEEQPDVYVTKTVSISVYKTLREDPDTETVYRTITKTAKYHPVKTASRLSDEQSRGKKSGMFFNCDMRMSHCKGQGATSNKGGNGQPRTIINTIYAIKKTDNNGDNSGNGDDRSSGF